MTNTIRITLPNSENKVDVRLFASDDPFESMDSYIAKELTPIVIGNVPEAVWIRCSATGFKMGMYMPEEVELTIRQAAIATGFWAYNDMVDGYDQDAFRDDLESLLDDVAIRSLIISRKSPAVATSGGRTSIATAPRPRQLMALLSQLLYDTGLFRTKNPPFEEIVSRYRRNAATADAIAAEWAGQLGTGSESVESNRFEDLFAGLVELDAKWQIKDLRFSNKELAQLKVFAESERLDIDAFRAFVWGLIIFRDKHAELNPGSSWTTKAYREVTFQSFIPERSNVPPTDNGPSNRHIKNPVHPKPKAATAKRKSKSKDPNRAAFLDIVGGLF